MKALQVGIGKGQLTTPVAEPAEYVFSQIPQQLLAGDAATII